MLLEVDSDPLKSNFLGVNLECLYRILNPLFVTTKIYCFFCQSGVFVRTIKQKEHRLKGGILVDCGQWPSHQSRYGR